MGTGTQPPSMSTPEMNTTLDESATTESETRRPVLIRESHGYGYPLWVVGMGTGGCGCGYRFWIPTPIPIPTWWVFRG